jgi:predicted NACHT family NTPase
MTRASRSLKASLGGIKKARRAYNNGAWTQESLAEQVNLRTRQPVGNFFAGKPIDRHVFIEICTALELNWEEIAEKVEPEPSDPLDLEALVQAVREQVKPSIQKRCGTMRVLDMEQPIGLDAIYTTVNILEKVTRNRRLRISELLKDCNLEDFDRFTLSSVQQRRVPGLEAVKHYDKLLILGKPGAGKTTFLKWIAIQCNAGKLHNDRVPIFITLKEFAEAPSKPTLLNYISNQLKDCDVNNAEAARALLREGRSLVLLDGLDEVRDAGHDRVLQEIRSVSDQFDANQFVMTCRIAAKEYTFERFTEVEIADFEDEQIVEFSRKWFQIKDPVKAEDFPKALQANRPLKDLATNPLLLTLLCLVFEERAGFPANRSELYKEGLDVLLKKWDVKRNIKRDEVYKYLSRKEDLLSQIAFTTFEQSEYFFKQKALEEQIKQYIYNLPNAKTDPEALQLDSEAVLKSIEAQHGLLVERARGIYSFSHLTFQEYFTARQLKEERSDELQESLVSHITEKRWREVFLLTIGMLKNADLLLKLMKDQVDALLRRDSRLQQFLGWVNQKSLSVSAPYNPAAIRAFYFARTLTRDRDIDRTIEDYLALARTLDLAFIFDIHFDIQVARDMSILNAIKRTLDLAIDRELALDHELFYLDSSIPRPRDPARDLDLALDLDLDLALGRALFFERSYLDLDLNLARNRDLALDLARARDREFDLARDLDLDLARDRNCGPELQHELQQLKEQLPGDENSKYNKQQCTQWWQRNGRAWINQLRTVMIEYCNTGHDWQFSNDQKKLLQQYYDANQLLVDCLNSDCYVSREVRKEIEGSLLLPVRGEE